MPKFYKFLEVCKKCKAFCCKLDGPTLTEKEKNKILKAGFKDYFIKIGKGLYDVKTKQQVCPYLKKDYSCEIQKVKPRLCLAWPIIPYYKKGKRFYEIIKCPLYPYLNKKEIKKARKEASRISIDMIKNIWEMPLSMKKKIKKFGHEEI